MLTGLTVMIAAVSTAPDARANGYPGKRRLPKARFSQYANNYSPSSADQAENGQTCRSLRSSLPATVLDSFVLQSGLDKHIYGGEGYLEPEDLSDGFSSARRIETGIDRQSKEGLTTGHGSYLPSAWGYDQYTLPAGGEFPNADLENWQGEHSFSAPRQGFNFDLQQTL